jgi:peptidoglycan-N-acetylglucosamine deacetylase
MTNLLLLSLLIIIPVGFYLTKKVLKKISYSTEIQLLGTMVSNVPTQAKTIALTYDDGPNPPYTHQLLDVLNRHQVKATFFVLGKQIEQYPDTIRSMISQGHELGNHSYSHPYMTWKKPAFLQSEIIKTDRLLRSHGVEGEILFRAPFGLKFLVLPYILNKLNKTNVLWNIDPQDFATSDPNEIVDRIMSKLTPGSIVLLHDALDDLKGDRSGTIAATEILIQKLHAQGYQFKTVSELIASN